MRYLRFEYPIWHLITVLVCLNIRPVYANQCAVECAFTSDFISENSPINFSRIHYSHTSQPKDSTLNSSDSWRHQYEIVLTHESGILSVFDHQGTRHDFVLDSQTNYISTSANSGTLNQVNGQFRWTDNNGTIHQFENSLLVGTTNSDGEVLKLSYNDEGILNSIQDTQGNSLSLQYEANRLAQLTSSSGEIVPLLTHECSAPFTSEDTHCSNVNGQNNHTFSDSTRQPHVIAIDSRPASCQSFFTDYYGTERGSRIEAAIAQTHPYSSMQSTVRSYPIVDFIDADRWLVLRSRDLASPSFNNDQNPNALLHRLMRDGKEIQDNFLSPLFEQGEVSATENGVTTTLTARPDSQNLVLQLVIRDRIASASHWRQIEIARTQLLEKYGILLEVVIIP